MVTSISSARVFSFFNTFLSRQHTNSWCVGTAMMGADVREVYTNSWNTLCVIVFLQCSSAAVTNNACLLSAAALLAHRCNIHLNSEQTDRQTDRNSEQTDRNSEQTDRQTDRQTESGNTEL